MRLFTTAPTLHSIREWPVNSCVGDVYTLTVLTDAVGRAMVHQHFRGLVPIYDSFPTNVSRSDVARLVALYVHGGVYLDRDYVCFRNFERHRWNMSAFSIAAQFPARCRQSMCSVSQRVANAFMASAPRHPFIKYVLGQMRSYRGGDAAHVTGPGLLTRSVDRWSGSPVVELGFCTVYGVAWFERHPCTRRMDRDLCARFFSAAALGTHLWDGSWLPSKRRVKRPRAHHCKKSP